MIKVLPKEVADKIAAGEVIESPMSIVKELVENSIDAGATSIACDITKGGKEEIRITDNGIGIHSDEVETAFLRHATSKITKTEDLKNLITLGFRGEALASIAAVSRVELVTKHADDKTGTRFIIHGGQVISKEPIGCPEGTTIIIKDLFYNMPARAKFMKSEAAEAGKIIDMMSRLAITKPDIRFTLISNGKNYFNTFGNGKLKDAILSVYKDREFKELIPIIENSSSYNDGIRVYGYLSRPSFTRTNRRSQYQFVNGRAVKNNTLDKGIDLGYKERLFEGRFPIVFLFIDIDPSKIDVNVHPNKKEVRFNDEIAVMTAVQEAIKNSIATEASVIKAVDTLAEKKNPQKESKQVDIKQFLSTNSDFIEDEKANLGFKEDEFLQSSFNEQEKTYTEYSSIVLGTPDMEYKGMKPFDFDDLSFKGTIFGTYILATDSDNFYLFDQHAAHERVNYERLLNLYLSGETESQLVLTPFTFDVPLNMAEAESEWIEIINNMGYNVENFGENTYIVREIPIFLSIGESESFINTFIDSFSEDLKKDNQIIIDKIITKSCKSSIKANDYIKDLEIQALINDLKHCNNPFSCPHGRPTFISFSKYDIERMFKRIV